MNARTDDELLQLYRNQSSRSDEAFRVLVERHTDLVYGVAVRNTGRADAAEDIVQEVFIMLARKALQKEGLRMRSTLVNWIFQTTHYCLADYRKALRRRMVREAKHAVLEEARHEEDAGVSRLLPLLDEALGWLREEERAAVLAHYFEGRTFVEIAERTGGQRSAEAVRKLVVRAVVRLGDRLRDRGEILSGGILGAALGAAASQSAPPGLGARVAGEALRAGTQWAGGGSGTGISLLLSPVVARLATFAAVVAGVASPLVFMWPAIAARMITGPPAPAVSSSTPASEQAELKFAAGFAIDPEWLVTEYSKAESDQKLLPRQLALEKLVHSLSEGELRNLLSWIAAENLSGMGVVQALYARWAEIDPRGAIDYIEGDNRRSPSTGVRIVLAPWAAADPYGLSQWILENPEDRLPLSIEELATASPEHALKVAQQEPESNRDTLVAIGLKEKLAREFDAGMAWIEQNTSPGGERDALVLQIGKSSRPGIALALASTIGSREAAEEIVKSALTSRAHENPLAAMNDFAALPEALATDTLLQTILRKWKELDEKSAAHWVETNLGRSLEELLQEVQP